jgi:hypothetical protein
MLTAETIEFEYVGPIDKPLRILILNQSDEQFDVQYSLRANDPYSGVGMRIVVELTIPSMNYNVILEKVIASSERPLLRRDMFFFCLVSSGYTKTFYRINVEDLIYILEDAMVAIVNEEVIREINNYFNNVKILLERFGAG